MGFEDWTDRIIPNAIGAAADHATGPVHIVAWCLGGSISLLTLASRQDLPVVSLVAVGTAIDYAKIPAAAPQRQVANITGGHLLGTASRVFGGIPPRFVQTVFRLAGVQREITKPLFILRNAHDPEKIEHMRSVDGFIAAMPAYPGKLFDEMWYRLVLANDLNRGYLQLKDRRIDLGRVNVPVLAIGGMSDAIAPVPAAQAVTRILTGAPSVRFESAPGGHLGVLTGSSARTTTWNFIDDHLADFSEMQE